MIQQQDTRFDDLVTLINSTPDAQLESTVAARPGGVDEALDVVLGKMAALFNPAKAKSARGTFQYEVVSSDGTQRPYLLRVENGSCTPERGTSDAAEVTMTMKLVDMLHMATGKLSGQKAFLTGKIKIRGNPFFGMKLGEWFDPI